MIIKRTQNPLVCGALHNIILEEESESYPLGDLDDPDPCPLHQNEDASDADDENSDTGNFLCTKILDFKQI